MTEKYGGNIPKTLAELTELPWVGVKTAKVVLNVLYDASYVAVDTHVHRVINRLGIAKTKDPLETDKVLDNISSADLKKKIHHPLVLFGRYFCTARSPKCQECKIADACQYYKENFKK